jgi:glycine cleavage system H protein
MCASLLFSIIHSEIRIYSDFVQQRNGDVAFAEVKPEGTIVAFGDEVAVIETIKVDIAYSSPVSGEVIEVNPAMEEAPEAINQDPYGEGALAFLKTHFKGKARELLEGG